MNIFSSDLIHLKHHNSLVLFNDGALSISCMRRVHLSEAFFRDFGF